MIRLACSVLLVADTRSSAHYIRSAPLHLIIHIFSPPQRTQSLVRRHVIGVRAFLLVVDVLRIRAGVDEGKLIEELGVLFELLDSQTMHALSLDEREEDALADGLEDVG